MKKYIVIILVVLFLTVITTEALGKGVSVGGNHYVHGIGHIDAWKWRRTAAANYFTDWYGESINEYVDIDDLATYISDPETEAFFAMAHGAYNLALFCNGSLL